MGGSRSGNYYNHKPKRRTTGQMLSIDINSLRKKGRFEYINGYLTYFRNSEQTASIGYIIKAEQKEIVLSWNSKSEPFEQRIRLNTTRQPFGNERYYFECPKCKKRVFKLYAGTMFYCRKCWNLTYKSCQESRFYDSLFRRYGFSKSEIESMKAFEKISKLENQIEYAANPGTRRKLKRKLLKIENEYYK